MRNSFASLAVATTLALAACSGTKTTPGVNRSLAAIQSSEPVKFPDPVDPRANPRSPSAWEQSALDLQAVVNEAEESHQPEPSPEPVPATEQAVSVSRGGDEEVEAVHTPAEEPVVEQVEPPLPAESLDGRIDRLTEELVEALRERARNGEGVSDVLCLALLESIFPGALGDGAEPDLELVGSFTPAEVAHVVAARDLARRWVGAGGSTDEVAEALLAAASSLRAADPILVITDVQLCERVDGYAAYMPFADTTFIAGQINSMIVYTELDGFAHRAVKPGDRAPSGDQWAVEVSQELTLYHEPSDNLQAWHQPRATVVTTSRRHRREFFLVNSISLPANLSVGSYRLKVLTRDEVSGATAEASMPIRIVADSRLVGAQQR